MGPRCRLSHPTSSSPSDGRTQGMTMARTFGVLWLLCALAGPIVGIISSIAFWSLEAVECLAIGLIVVNLVNAGVASRYIWSYRALCRDRDYFALTSLLPTLGPNAPLLCVAGVAAVLLKTPDSLDVAIACIVCIAIACTVLLTAIAWMRNRPTLHLAALASAGIALGVMGLVLTIASVMDGFGEADFEIFNPIVLCTGLFSFPSLWMAIAFLRCLRIEPAPGKHRDGAAGQDSVPSTRYGVRGTSHFPIVSCSRSCVHPPSPKRQRRASPPATRDDYLSTRHPLTLSPARRG